MIMAVLVVLPVLAEHVHDEQIDRNDRVEAAYKQALSFARQGAATQNEILVSLRGILQSVASARSTFKFSNADCDQFLAKITKPIPWIQALSVADLRGRVICSSFPDAIGLDISETPAFHRGGGDPRVHAQRLLVRDAREIPIMTGALPQIGDDGELAGVVLGVIDLSWLGRIANDFVTPLGSMLMIDGSGIVLAQYPDGQKPRRPRLQGRSADPEYAHKFLRPGDRTGPRRCPPHLRLCAVAPTPRRVSPSASTSRRFSGAPTMECGPRWRSSVR